MCGCCSACVAHTYKHPLNIAQSARRDFKALFQGSALTSREKNIKTANNSHLKSKKKWHVQFEKDRLFLQVVYFKKALPPTSFPKQQKLFDQEDL